MQKKNSAVIKITFSITLILTLNCVVAQIPGTTVRPTATPINAPGTYETTTINYIRTWAPAVPTADTAYVISPARVVAEVQQSTQYLDGLGRLVQTVSKGLSAGGNDLVVPVAYDFFGRQEAKYLPYTTTGVSDGSFKTAPFNAQAAFYQSQLPGERIYYNRIDYEASPLNRIIKNYAPGNSWAKNDPNGIEKGGNRPVETQYLVNKASDSVRIWSLNIGDVKPVNSNGSVYDAGQLYKQTTIDEVGNQVIEYSDKDGRMVLKKVQFSVSPGSGHMGWLCSYYVYDELGLLRFVITPRAVEAIMVNNWSINNMIAGELCFIYRFDGRRRMIVKKVPGADSTEMVYDVRDRLAFIRDGNMKGKNWQATFYDSLNRPVMTALYKNATATRESLQTTMSGIAGSSSKNITYNFPAPADMLLDTYDGKPLYQATNSISLVSGFETGIGAETSLEINPAATSGSSIIAATVTPTNISVDSLTPLTYTYYDGYTFSGAQSYANGDITKPQADGSPSAESLPATSSTMVKGLVTGTKVRVLGTNQWLTTTNHYNDKGRLIQVQANNVNGGLDVTTNLYDFNGKVLSTYLRHKNLRSSLSPQTTVLTMLHYDAAGRLTSVKKRLNDASPLLDKTIVANTYNELGQMKTKRLGVTPTGQLETLTYDYNIQGWLTGMNKAFASTPGSISNWFGQTLAYDSGFTVLQYNGNIAGSTWKSRSDGISRAYGYGYDKVNRLLAANFKQQNNNSPNWTSDQKDFSVSNLNYDANGNIQTMNQMGMVGVGAPRPIDKLVYTYGKSGNAYTNKLSAVVDTCNTTSAKLGDFINGTNSGDDYDYDANGNLKYDLNKNITTITYNHMNLPDNIVITGKGSIKYLYDARGTKLRKVITDNTATPAKTTTTDYIGGMVYQNDTLQFVGHEEGRIRPVFKTGRDPQYPFDYFVKDHLGNIRMVLTDKPDSTFYAATMEKPAAAMETAMFSNIDNTRADKPVGYPADESAGKNASVAKLTATGSGKKIGPSIVLRVMAGDTIQLSAKAFYKSEGPAAQKSPLAITESMVADLVQAFGGSSRESRSTHGVSSEDQLTPFNSNFYNNDYQRLKEKEPDQPDANRPKAYLNFVLFDDDFKLVEENSGVKQVKEEPDQLQTLGQDKMVIQKSGFLYAYTSNESIQPVYFDNILLGVNTGPLLEETHYYPFGLTMAGISSNALKGTNYPENRKKYNGNELQSKEFSDGSGLEWYDFNARTYDQQIGRFMQIDPLIESGEQETISPYHFAKNNPVKYNDPDGKCPNCLVGGIVGFFVDAVLQVSVSVSRTIAKGDPVTPASIWNDFSGAQSAAATAVGALTSGLSAVEQVGVSLAVKTVAAQGAISIWRQQAQNGSVNPTELVIDALPIPEGPAKKIVNTRPAEKAVRQAENALNATTSRIPQRKINAVNQAKATLERQGEINTAYDLTGEAAKGAAGRTAINETRIAAENTTEGSGSIPLNSVPAPPADNTRIVIKPPY